MHDTHRIPDRFEAEVFGSSEGLGWSSLFASLQRERPYNGRLHAVSSSLMVLHRGGPVDIAYTVEGRSITRHLPKGGVFFLPAEHACDVSLRAPLDSTHIYLRSDLFSEDDMKARNIINGLAPMLGERDAVLEHLAAAVGDTIASNLPASSLFVDPIARAIANRFVTLNFHKCTVPDKAHPRLCHRHMNRVREFLEANIATDIRIEMLARLCGLRSEYFVKQFKATTGVSPYQYVLSLRIERAKSLLANEKLSIAEIALDCGFSHQEHLTRLFRRFTGATPGRYRRDNH